MFSGIGARLLTRTVHTEAKARRGSTHKLFDILKEHAPLTADEFWGHAQKEGIKSKTHMKQLLAHMRKWGHVQTRKPAVPADATGKARKNVTFVYDVPAPTVS
mmetsp:Transcript_14136/g.45097  ORF Transcript_14136/g.45097 Transcript_14136/m.45097 type:complete len:103 (-) Transcript_14136:94-402(-)